LVKNALGISSLESNEKAGYSSGFLLIYIGLL
jgi:hypothetical protein